MEDTMTITPLGSGQEVGRSCHLMEFRGQNILLDCGIHPGHSGMNGLPYLDRIEPESIDVVLITHFHLDHAASLPYLTERTNFRGRIFMTHPTKAVLRLLLGDYLRLMGMNKSEDVLYTEQELETCLSKVELVDYHTTVTVGNGFKFHALNAGHVLGACMFFMELGGRSVLYTGDFSMENDRHLMAAEIPHKQPDLLITESTYGVQVHASRAEREARFTQTIERVVSRGGRCLIPVFALGRAQELLLILDEYWQANPHLQDVPLYYASRLASRALRVYQTYANMMNAKIRAQMDVSNPFHFQFIQNLKSIDVNQFDDSGPSVVFASPGMLQSGVSRQLFDRWAANSKNGVLIAGYAVEHTLAKEILSQPKEVVTMEGRKQPLACLVEYISFSAHCDFVQNRSFIQQVAPRHIVLVHGQKDEMGRLKSALMLQYRTWPEAKRPTITMPPNLQEVKLRFARRRSAKVLGQLAQGQAPTQPNTSVQGILVTQNFHSKLVAPEDVATYTPLRVGTIASKLHVPFAGSATTLQVFLQEMFRGMQIIRGDGSNDSSDNTEMDDTLLTVFKLQDLVQVVVPPQKDRSTILVEWDASPQGDVLADAVVALILHAQSSAASVRMTSQPCRHYRGGEEPPMSDANENDSNKKAKTRGAHNERRLKFLYASLKDQFENVEALYEANQGTFEISTDSGLQTTKAVAEGESEVKCTVKVVLDEMQDGAHVSVESLDEQLATNVRDCIQSITHAMQPL